MTTLEDKILGEKTHYYCSSDEDEEQGPSVVQPPADEKQQHMGSTIRSTEYTGPKGVINDWREFKRLQTEQNQEKERESARLMKKLCLTGETKAEEEARRQDEELDVELLELMSEEVLQEFQRKRLAEITSKLGKPGHFGQLLDLKDGDQFLQAVEDQSNSLVLVHIYENRVAACRCMNECLDRLARDIPFVKFCKILSSSAGVSAQFKKMALPALIAYKAGQVIGNFVRMSDELGDEFFDSDVENFLIENGVLVERELHYGGVAQ